MRASSTGVATDRSTLSAVQITIVAICAVVIMIAARVAMVDGQQSPVAAMPCLQRPIVASPVAGSPSASSPVAQASPTVRGASAVSGAVQASVANTIACWNEADWQTSVHCVTDNYLTQHFGTVDRVGYVALHERLTSVGLTASAVLIGVGTVRDVGPGFATADVTWQSGNALKSERWHFALVDGLWLIEQVRPQPPELSGDIVGFELVIDDAGIHVSRERIVNPGIVVVRVRNLTSGTVSMSLVRLATLGDVRSRFSAGPIVGNDTILAGEVTIADQEEFDMVLVDLREGAYTFVGGLTIPFGPDGLRDEFSAPFSVSLP